MSSTQQLLLGEGAGSSIPVYIEDVFSCFVYTGAGTSNIITNNIDLSTKGGLVWTKMRTSPASNQHDHRWSDSAIGVNQVLSSNNTNPKTSSASFGITSFNVDGYTITNSGGNGGWNYTNDTFVSWTFRKQPKFFDIVTYTGNGTSQTISHNLTTPPGCIITKRTDLGSNWLVWHKSISTQRIYLNQNGAATGTIGITAIGASTYDVNSSSELNENGATYVAYIFASQAGGFGLTGTNDVIICGSYVGNGSVNGPIVTLGYEPQWVMIKNATSSGGWELYDNMRGVATGGNDARLLANSAAPEEGTSDILSFNATDFQPTNIFGDTNGSGSTYIYMAICRGPMAVPTVGTSVFTTILQTPQSAGTVRTVGFPADWMIGTYRSAGTPRYVNTRLIGLANNSGASQTTPKLATDSSAAQADAYPLFYDVWNTTAKDGDYIFGSNGVNWMFGRASSFFDVVCYSGNSVTGQTYSHNLTIVPEMMIVKRRNQAGNDWFVYHKDLTSGNIIKLNTTAGSTSNTSIFTTTAPTASVFSVGGASDVNNSAGTYVAYLFATCAGVSKVGSYTGNGTTQTINCGFTGGARFVLLRRTDASGDWYVYDTARGMTTLTDPYSLLNSATAEVATLGSVTTVSTGFALNSAILAAINVSAGTYIFLAIA